MAASHATLLVINAGSTSIKFALYHYAGLTPASHGEVSGIGSASSTFSGQAANRAPVVRRFAIPESVTAMYIMLDWLIEQAEFDGIVCVVHRIVHGGAHLRATCELTEPVLIALYDGRTADLEHLPQELRLVEAMRRRFFDAGIMRLGYHGISCQFIVRQLRALPEPSMAEGKVVIAHLGGGASVTAVEHGRSVDTSMGLTPAGGIPMSTRAGDIDPGFAWHCAHVDKMRAAEVNHMLSHQSGLRGISGTTGDMAELLAAEASDLCAAEAVALFCYQARKAIGAMAAALGGLDVLVFAGGIGEHGSAVRARICEQLAWLDVRLDPQRNADGAALISMPDSRVAVRIIETDEQWMLAENARIFLADDAKRVGGASFESIR